MRWQSDTQRGCHLVQGICNPAVSDTTSEPQGRNALPGAPVNASMSGSFQSNQGGTVEYCNYCIPPLIFSGDGYFLYLPHIKRR